MDQMFQANTSAIDDGALSLKPKPSCISLLGQYFEVFLSFRGEDTRTGITDHLYNKLVDAGVRVFRDSEGLHVGEQIGPKLIKTIKASKILIPIISPNYASSGWCLKELVEILECKKTGQIVIPIFYKVTPTDVRNQMGEFGKAFHLHQKKDGSNAIQKWRNALKEVASLKGLESNKIVDRHEGELVKEVLRTVLKKLKKVDLVTSDHLIGLQAHIEKFIKMVNTKASEVQVVLIHGMGGIGKTTFAKLVYNQFSSQFEHRSFLPNVRERSSDERGKVDLQKQLISNILGLESAEGISYIDEGINIIRERFCQKKILLLLDDIDHRDQLNFLVREINWIGLGSILIVTSRNSGILANWENTMKYELKELDQEQSFQLFCLHAFGRDSARERELETIAKEIVSRTGGLPLAIEVIGSLLFAKSIESWEDTLKILKETPNNEVMGKLKISYDSLEHAEQQIFLDIACFSFEEERDFTYYMWDACGFHPRVRIKNLITLSLIKIGNKGQLVMHDQLRDLGKEIVHQEGLIDLGRRSRLWNTEEAWDVLEEKRGTNEVQALRLHCRSKGKPKGKRLTSEHFKDLKNLRFLQIDPVNLVGDFENLFSNLRWLQSIGFNMPTNFHPKKLVVLDSSFSSISEYWSGWNQVELVQKLKVLRLCSCYNLTTSPDFSEFKTLEILILQRCERLSNIHPSICNIKETLITLDISWCKQLEELPAEFGEMEKLKKLIVDHTLINEIPISEGSMKKLEILSAIGCEKLSKLPESIGSLVNLHSLSLQSCSSLVKIPESIGKLESLVKLDMSETKIMELPESIGDLHNLKELNISSTPLKRLTPAIGKLKKLQILSAEYLHSLIVKEVPNIGELSCLQCLSLKGSLVSCLPGSIYRLSSLQTLDLFQCLKLTSLPDLACNLKNLCFHGNSLKEFPKISTFKSASSALKLGNLNKLEKLSVFNCGAFHILQDLSNLKHLSYLQLYDCNKLVEISGLEGLESLKTMKISRCSKLSKVSGIPASLMYWSIQYCVALENLPHLSTAINLRTLDVEACSSLVELQGLDSLEYLEVLRIDMSSCPIGRSDLYNLTRLRDLQLELVKQIGDAGFNQLISLETLELYEFVGLKRIGNLSHLKRLKSLKLVNCKMLREVEGIDKLSSLRTLKIVGCNPSFKFPDTSKLINLEHLEMNYTEYSGPYPS